MIIVKLWGGMCNQMFQYAFGYTLSKKVDDEKLLFDVEFYNKQPNHVGIRTIIGKRQFPQLSIEETGRPLIIKLLENKYVSHLLRHNTGASIRFPNLSFCMEKLKQHSCAKFYTDIPYNKASINYYDGYWQSSRYFADYQNEILHLFTPQKTIIDKVNHWRQSIDSDCCVAVHVRRGDYVVSKNFRKGSLSVVGRKDYYLDGIEYMKNKLNCPYFCFFSDDIEWCKMTFSDIPNASFVENYGPDASLLDLFSIASCEHGIMSQSTFSWWGNWLRGEKNNTIVLCPKHGLTNEFFAEDYFVLI